MSTLKKRTILVENMSCTGCEEKINTELAKINGVHDVQADHHSGEIKVVYDLLKTDLKTIEQKIEEIGYSIHESFFNHVKDKYIHFTEVNERDNLNAPPMPCCSYPDKALSRIKHEIR